MISKECNMELWFLTLFLLWQMMLEPYNPLASGYSAWTDSKYLFLVISAGIIRVSQPTDVIYYSH